MVDTYAQIAKTQKYQKVFAKIVVIMMNVILKMIPIQILQILIQIFVIQY
jgi:hypothetical protein